MTWTLNSSLHTNLRDAQNNLVREARQSASLQNVVSGQIALAASGTLTFFGGAGGLFDSAFSLIRFIRLEVSGGQLDVRCAKTTAQTNSMRIDDDGLYYVPAGEADHVVVQNPSSTDALTITFSLGGDI